MESQEVLEVKSLDALADKGYYNSEEIKKCVENNTIPYIPEPETKQPKKDNGLEPEYYDSEFKYDAYKDVYTCPKGEELNFSDMSEKSERMMKKYRSESCSARECKSKCTQSKKSRIIFRWKHEKILDDVRKRVKENEDMVKKRNCMCEHPFRTIKRGGFNQGYLLLKGLKKVGGEIGLRVRSLSSDDSHARWQRNMALNAKPLTFWVLRTSVIKPEEANSSLGGRRHARSSYRR